MLNKNQRTRAVLDSLVDALLLFLAYLLSNYLRFN